jgi:hypothetical protein
MISIVAVGIIASASCVFVAWPFLAPREGTPAVPAAADRLELLERRDRALAAMQELEFELQAGTVSPADHVALAARLRAEAATAIDALRAER